MKKLILLPLLALIASACTPKDTLRDNFVSPPNEFRPMPLWHLNGHLTTEGITRQITEARDLSGYGGMTVLPVTPIAHWFDGHMCPGMTPEYLSDEYFARYNDMLTVSKELGTQIVLYDDIDFPTGSAGGRLLREYPQYCRKYLIKDEFDTKGGAVSKTYALKPTQSFLALSAMNIATQEVVDLGPMLADNKLQWTAPQGDWKVMAFLIEYNVGPPHGHLVDYMEPAAVAKVMEMTYAEYDKRFSQYFGNVIQKTFFDDIGFVFMEQTWNKEISTIFQEKTGKNPALYYPALFYDIGPETAAARVAFLDARSELMAEGYVKMVSEWAAKRNLSSMGHPPENYSPNTVVTSGDLLKFYRHAHIPLLDVIFAYGRGRNGYKQISSAADLGDKGLVGAELNGAFPEDMDSLTLYRTAMEVMARGINFLVPHGLWYNPDPDSIRIPPLISHENPYWGKAVKHYSEFTARSCAMLQNGRHVVDVAMLWPINAIQGETWIFRDLDLHYAGATLAHWLPDSVNNYRLSGVLTDELRRDFTYIHPENLLDGKVTAQGSELVLNNVSNKQNFKVLIMPGGDVISASTLAAIKAYYDGGGKVIATGSLPTRAAEFGRDSEVQSLIAEMFSQKPVDKTMIKNPAGGCFAFLPLADKATLKEAMDGMGLLADVAFDDAKIAPAPVGCVNYLHKQKDGREIYYFINSTDNPVSTTLTLRGEVKSPETWNPHSGKMEKIRSVKYEKAPDGSPVTVLPLELKPVESLFIVAKQ